MNCQNGIFINDSTSNSEALYSKAHRVVNISLLKVHLVTYLSGIDVNGGRDTHSSKCTSS